VQAVARARLLPQVRARPSSPPPGRFSLDFLWRATQGREWATVG